MKTIIKGLFMAALLCVSFTSCRDDAELPDRGPVMHPEIETAGVYNGTWIRTNTSTNVEEAAAGTMTLVAGDHAYYTSINIKAVALDLDRTAMANIVGHGEGWAFQNTDDTNPFGNIFSGTISKEGVIKIYFKNTIVDGRKRTTYEYSFEGNKAAN